VNIITQEAGLSCSFLSREYTSQAQCGIVGRADWMTGKRSIAALPKFDFRSLPLCEASRNQLAGIYNYVLNSGILPNQKTMLLNDFILKNAYATERGLYVPLSDSVWLTGKLPEFSERVATNSSIAHELAYFTNALAIPEGWGSNTFEAKAALNPTNRATNAGFLIVTIEHDCVTREEFEEHLGGPVVATGSRAA
jgi:hypothetical protein